MLETRSSAHTATAGAVPGPMRPAAAAVQRRALATAALLSVVLGCALSQLLTAEHGSPTAAVHRRPSPPQRGLSSLPLSAQAPISAALGADDAAYHVRAARGGFQAANPAQRLQESFDPSGVGVTSGGSQLGLSLRAVGYGNSLTALPAGFPRATANRVTYVHPGLSEWYRNGPLGLEQGFTIARVRARRADAPLTLSLALSGHMRVSLGAGGQSLTLSRRGGPALLYGGLVASDARGRALRSWLELRGGDVLLRVDARGARFPVRIDPFIQQGEKLVGAGQSGPVIPRMGYSVALESKEGNTALIGGPEDYGKTGAVWVFTRSGSTWTQQGSKLAGKGESGEGRFGASVALSAEGNTAVIGGPLDNNGSGAAWVFTRSGSTWTQQGPKLAVSVAAGVVPEFGSSVALSADGNTALIGGPGESKGVGVGAEERTGAVWVFTRSGSTWTQQEKFTGAEELSEKRPSEEQAAKFPSEFGTSVALSADGNTAFIGGHGDNKGVGAAWAFTRASFGSAYSQQGKKLTAAEEVSSETAPGEFGASVALESKEGNTALIGGPGDNKGVGAAWAFTRSGSKFTQQGAKLTGNGEVSEEPGAGKFPGRFGSSVALSAEGSALTALMGGPGDSKGVGAAWAFTRSGSTWTQQGAKLTGSEGKGVSEFGSSVALSGNGATALMGGPGDNSELGAVWAFTRNTEAKWGQQGPKLTGSGAAARSAGHQGMSVALSFDGNTALIGGPEDGHGAAWVFTRAGSTWTQQGEKLTGSEEVGERPSFGSSVALSSDGNTAMIGGPNDARIFEREGEVTEKSTIVKGLSSTSDIFTRNAVSGTKIPSGTIVAKVLGEHELELSAAVEGTGTATVKQKLTFTQAEVGAAWAFTRSGSTWTQQGPKLAGTGGSTGIKFGASASLSSDGNTALIGGPGDKGMMGAAWAFTRSGSTWTQQGGKLTGSGAVGPTSEFGASVALSGDGNTALIGGPFDNALVGAAWVFTRSGSTWTQQGSKLTAGEGKGFSEFGASVALSGNGNTALIGGPGDNAEVGAAWVFTRSGSTWTQQGPKLTGTGETGKALFGSSVALSSEGSTALIGGGADNSQAGAVWAFTRSGSTWTQQGAKFTGSGASGATDRFGASVALSSAEGNTALIGGPGDYNNTGAVWTFFQNLPTVVTEPASSVAQTTATLNGKVNPDGFEVSECKFEYGTTEAYGSSAPCTPAPGSGTSAVAVSAAISGLTQLTTYHFRILAKNANGESKGADQSFKTLGPPPTVVTEAASAVTQTSATVRASVNPNGVEVGECKFEYGTTTAYGSSATCTPAPGSGTSPVAVSAALESLAEGTTYHFRISATSAGGTSLGSDQTFTTLLVLGPHWYQNNVRLSETAPEGGLLIMAWGKLTLENAKVGAITCQTLAGGDLSNPVGGGAGKGLFDAFGFYDCVAPACEASKGLEEVVPERLKWSSVVIEEAGLFRDRIEGIALRAICVGGASNVEFHGSLKPEFEAGTAQGSAPAKLRFGVGSGSLESTEGATAVTGKLRFMGFEGGEIIGARKT